MTHGKEVMACDCVACYPGNPEHGKARAANLREMVQSWSDYDLGSVLDNRTRYSQDTVKQAVIEWNKRQAAKA